jgi:hypothetical protein
MSQSTDGPENFPQPEKENPLPGGEAALRSEEEDLAIDHALWSLLVQLSRKLQVSSASIKAGVSSLLDYNIFWDGSTQHEFLESINDSSDQVSRLVTLLSLVSRTKAGSLEMKAEPQMLQEIVSMVREQVRKEANHLTIANTNTLPHSGQPVLVDYEYLMLGLRFLFEVLASSLTESETVQIFAFESGQEWKMDIVSRMAIIQPFTLMVEEKILDLLTGGMVNAENRLKLYMIYRIFLQMKITVEFVEYADHQAGLRLRVPGVLVEEKTSKSSK